MTLGIDWSAKAEEDREDIFQYLYEKAGLSVALDTDRKFIELAELLAENPKAGVLVKRAGKVRKLVVAYLPFVMVYLVGEVNITLIRLLHTSRRITMRYQ